MVEAAGNPRGRAFIIVLYESGARIGEIGSMNVGDVFVPPEGHYAKLRLKGKTGSREVNVAVSLPFYPLKTPSQCAQWFSSNQYLRLKRILEKHSKLLAQPFLNAQLPVQSTL